ncbi:MAG: leucine-rich repeat domain-containing protein [Crocinitomicaceae bacterium]
MRTYFFIIAMLSGVLSYSQKLNSLDLGVCDTIPKSLYSKRYLKKLSIRNSMGYCHSPVKVLSSKIAKLKALESLTYESSYNFAPLPPEVKKLKHLTHLSTSDIIVEISEITSLLSLKISVNSAKELDDLKALSFEKLVNLESLAISFRGDLKIAGNEKILNGLDQLKRLKNLYLFNVNAEILEQLPSIKSLTTINLNGVLGKKMIDFGKYPSLDTLLISRADDFRVIPSSFYQLKNLSKLTIRSSGVESFPEGISALKNLRHLELNFNKLQGLPEDITELKYLEILSLGRNFNLKKLPESIGNLTSLKRLVANSCQISHLPESITQLKNLEILFLSVNDLTELPTNWSNMASLKVLNLERNQLAKIPEGILQIESLEALSLNNNKLDSTNFMNQTMPIAGLVNLKKFSVQYNQLQALPHDIGSLKNLEDLNIYYNQITELPRSIIKLGKLNSLSMGHNKVSEFPEGMEGLKIYEFSFHTNAFKSGQDIRAHFPKVKRTWTDKEFEEELSKSPKLAKEVYFR